MQNQPWPATLGCVLVAFAGGYFAAGRTPLAPLPISGEAPHTQCACYFSPNGGCTDAIVREIESARRAVELEGYSFTSRPIGSALVAAAKRGVRVTLVLDASQTSEHRAEAIYVARAGIPVFLDARHAIAHNKIVLIDDQTIITGSFNFTRAAEQDNAENILILHDFPKLQSSYEDNFRVHLAHSQPFER